MSLTDLIENRIKRRTGMLAGGLMTLTLGIGSWLALSERGDISFYQVSIEDVVSYDSAWQRVSANFALDHHSDNPRVQRWISWYQDHPEMFADYAKQAAPWMHYVSREVEKRGLPGELALLPFVESGYNPLARSPKGPTGIWQLASATADDLGLRNTLGYAARQDVKASTTAALDYLELLQRQWYHGDWESTLAAYNAGPGRVNLARVESGTNSFWETRLPQETRNYVPKLLALATIVSDPERYGIELPHVDDAPSVVEINLDHSLDVASAAKLAGVAPAEIRRLNPAYVGNWVDNSLLIPSEAEQRFKEQLAILRSGDRQLEYVVAQGDTLSVISHHSGIPVEQIQHDNKLKGKPLKTGQTLLLAGA
ncbi:transglycosylase SLT domain-containing protein [Carnimonas nigrificans]|uniref:transglycosylase SLT domain-containing protein n=1 Tax=Carnimonas nigrificans TaxID=64323 RepID=UPI00046E89F7|nr:transglycosylase SLT domain-containing protein [Carnimonas nigrificans]